MVCIDPRACRRFAVLFMVMAYGLGLSGCSIVGGPRKSPLPTDGPTIDQVYKNHSENAATSASDSEKARSRLPLRAAAEFNPGPAREDAVRQIERRFTRVQNPDLVMFVFPHLANGKHPVPGYLTAFPMYDSVEYLLPGEASDNLDGQR